MIVRVGIGGVVARGVGGLAVVVVGTVVAVRVVGEQARGQACAMDGLARVADVVIAVGFVVMGDPRGVVVVGVVGVAIPTPLPEEYYS